MNIASQQHSGLITDKDIINGDFDPMELFNDIAADDVEDLVNKRGTVASRRSTLDLITSIFCQDDDNHHGTRNNDCNTQFQPISVEVGTSPFLLPSARSNNAAANGRATLDLFHSMLNQEDDTTQEQLYNETSCIAPVLSATIITESTCLNDERLFHEPLDYSNTNNDGRLEKMIQHQQLQLQLQKQQQELQQRRQALQSTFPCNNTNHKTNLEMAMEQTMTSQQRLHDWDKFQMGLKRSHSKTMRSSRVSRKKILFVLKKERNIKAKMSKKKMGKKLMKNTNSQPTNTARRTNTMMMKPYEKSSMTTSSITPLPICPKPCLGIPKAA